MRHFRLACAVLATWTYSAFSFAILDIEIVGGMEGAAPIAISPFENQTKSVLSEDVAHIVRSDLRRSGRFNPIAVADMPETPTDAERADYNLWKAANIESLVVGNVVKTPDRRYSITFHLIDVFKADVKETSSAYQLEQGELVLKKTHILMSHKVTVSGANLRKAAHRIADLIYEKLTGEKGAFSTRIAYVAYEPTLQSPYQLIVADADGHNQQYLVRSKQPLMSPAWSPDATQIAYVSFESERAAIYLQHLATGKRQKISSFKGINGAPAWSPDGKQLALVLSRDGNPEIYILDLWTKELRRLTDSYAIDTEPSFSPDGRAIIFTSNRGGRPQVYQMDLASKKITRLTFEGNYNAGASFTPDGKQIVMVHRGQDQFHIAKQDLDSGYLQVLTETRLDESPSLAPNGSMVIYGTLHNDQKVLAAVSIDGRFRARLPSRKGEVRSPSWSPFF